MNEQEESVNRYRVKIVLNDLIFDHGIQIGLKQGSRAAMQYEVDVILEEVLSMASARVSALTKKPVRLRWVNRGDPETNPLREVGELIVEVTE